jgi:F-type H+-transporting ATPase subunit epsilon
MKEFTLEIITPEGTFFNEDVNSVSLDVTFGRIQILANHVPFISRVLPSAAKLEGKNGKKLFAVMEGFIQFDNNHAVILTDAVEWADNIDRQRACAAR